MQQGQRQDLVCAGNGHPCGQPGQCPVHVYEEGPFAYSSLSAGRPGTPSQGWIYLLFEGGPKGGGTMVGPDYVKPTAPEPLEWLGSTDSKIESNIRDIKIITQNAVAFPISSISNIIVKTK